MISHLIVYLENPGVTPNTDGLPGLPQLRHMAGALVPMALVILTAVLVISGAAWALGSINGNAGYAGKGKLTFLTALGAAILIGSANALVGFFSGIKIG